MKLLLSGIFPDDPSTKSAKLVHPFNAIAYDLRRPWVMYLLSMYICVYDPSYCFIGEVTKQLFVVGFCITLFQSCLTDLIIDTKIPSLLSLDIAINAGKEF